MGIEGYVLLFSYTITPLPRYPVVPLPRYTPSNNDY